MLAASFLNLAATVNFLRQKNFLEIVIVCAGTGDNPASEDVIAAGALVDLLAPANDTQTRKCPNSVAARVAYVEAMRWGLEGTIGRAQNGRRLLDNPDLRSDVAFCAQRDVFDMVAIMDANGALKRL